MGAWVRPQTFARSHACDLCHFLSTGPVSGGGKAQIRKRATDGRGLCVFDAGYRVDVAVADALTCPAGRGRPLVGRRAIDVRGEDDMTIALRDELRVDLPLGVALVKEPDAL